MPDKYTSQVAGEKWSGTGMLSALVMLFWVIPLHAQLLTCESEFVAAKRQTVEVSPNGVDDTESIQCALDSAVTYGYPTVLLTDGSFHITSIVIQRFNGTFKGSGRESTILSVLDDSIDCAGMNTDGMTSAALKFANGEPRLRNMTILAGQACTGGAELQALVHFTGLPSGGSDCARDVMFGVADRLVIDNPDSNALNAILVAPEGTYAGGCKDNLQGSFKLNRSEITGFDTAITTSMRAAAQVDINFNLFAQNLADVVIPNASQSTTITRNEFIGIAAGGADYTGIKVLTNDTEAPASNRVVVHKNTFDVEAFGASMGSAIVFSQTEKIISLSTIASENIINLAGAGAYGIVSGGVSGSLVNGNRFSGSAAAGIYANPSSSQPSSDWGILANTGLKSMASEDSDIILGPDLSNSIVGADQTKDVQDLGTGNSVLPITADAELTDRVMQLESKLADLTSLFESHSGNIAAHHERYADAEAVTAVGPHFSGDHADLSNVTAEQHHDFLLAGVMRGTDPNTGQDTLTFTDMNVQVVSGSGSTDGAATGTGNLIIGYNETRGTGDERSGSHMLVIGRNNNYTAASFGGMVVGLHNQTSSSYASVSGGQSNTAAGIASSVTGGFANSATGDWSSVSGGHDNEASGNNTSVSAGFDNTASGGWSSVTGGTGNIASGQVGTVSGGKNNIAMADTATVSGGEANTASGISAAVSGGFDNSATGDWSAVSGGHSNEAIVKAAWAAGGFDNTAGGEWSSVSGGIANLASGENASVSGGQSNVASGWRSAVSGGTGNQSSGDWSSVSGGVSRTAGAAGCTVGDNGVDC